MPSYTVSFTSAARRDLKRLPIGVQHRIVAAAEGLTTDPRPGGVKVLKGSLRGYYRLRLGDYRIICEVRDRDLLILIVRLGNRRDIYE